jgi:hypothetical protein
MEVITYASRGPESSLLVRSQSDTTFIVGHDQTDIYSDETNPEVVVDLMHWQSSPHVTRMAMSVKEAEELVAELQRDITRVKALLNK